MEGAIFDLDGTLIDSMYVWDRLAYDYLVGLGYSPAKDIYKELRDMDLEESSTYLRDSYAISKSPKEIEDGMKDLIGYYYREVFELKPGVRNFLESLKSREVAMCIGTTTSEELVLPLVERLGIGDYFDFIQTEDKLGIRKTSGDFYGLALERMGSEKEATWVFEDALYAIRSAKEEGFRLVGVRDRSNEDILESIRLYSDIYIEDFNQLEADRLWRNF